MVRNRILVALLVLGALPAAAHHGPVYNAALYQAEDLIELDGVLTEIFWFNPHVRFRLTVVEPDGEEKIWELELSPNPRELEQAGYTPDDLIGKRARAAGYLSRRNEGSIGVMNFLFPDGRELVQGRRGTQREPLWSNRTMRDEFEVEIDPAKAAAAERAANGIFRVWGRRGGPGIEAAVSSAVLTEHGQALNEAYHPIADNDQLNCLQGMPETMFDPSPMEIVDEGSQIRIRVQQYDIERVIHMNSEAASAAEPSALGHSIGRWDSDTLVVTTSNVDWPYYSGLGTPQSSEVSFVETFALAPDGRTLNYSITIDDPVMFAEPLIIERTRAATPGVEIETFNCVAY